MASNGYQTAYCNGCLFYKDLGYKKICTLYFDDARADKLKPLSYSDGINNKYLYDKFFEYCEHWINVADLKNNFRKNFGIKMYDYGT